LEHEYECEKCNVLMYENLLTTLMVYENDVGVIFGEDGIISDENLPPYFVLECPLCKYIIKISFMEHFRKQQLEKMKNLSEIRLSIASKDLYKNEETNKLEEIHKYDGVILTDNFDEARGHSYCGYCEGFYDGDGYCNNGVKELCIVRRKKHFV